MLVLDLRRLKDAPINIEARVAADDPLWEGSGVSLAAPMSVEARAEATGAEGAWVRGFLETRIRSECRRCLEPMEVAVRADFHMLFDPTITAVEEDFTHYALDPEAEELDLGPSLRERLLLQAPEFPLCRAACRGLCVHCGADLNAGDCGCRPVETDPRWGPLQAIRGES